MTAGLLVGKAEIKLPAKVKVEPKKGKGEKIQIFELGLKGEETVLERFSSYIKAGGEVTIMEVEECTVDQCECKLGKVMGPDPRRHLVIRLDDVDVQPLNN